MKVRIAIPRTALGARLTSVCGGALTLVVLVVVSACSGPSTSSPSVPTFSPSVTVPATGTARATVPASDGATTPSPAPHTANVTVTVTVPPSSQVPDVAPVTGGGGTAGPRDVLLFGLGVAAMLAGAGGLAYRRWLTRGR